VHTTCVSIVLDEAFAQNKAAPEVTIAEVSALSKFDMEGATLEEAAKALGKKRSDEAAALLKRAGDDGITAVTGAYATLNELGRALAVDVAASAGQCTGPGIDLITRALADRDIEVRRRAKGRIERCGKAASAGLTEAVRGDDEAVRAAAAPWLASVAPSVALEPLADAVGKGAPETRLAVRNALSRAARSSSPGELRALLGRREVPAVARRDLLRAIGPRLAELRPEANAATMSLLQASPDMATRCLLVGPLAHLARSHDAEASERLAGLARRDPEWPVRARAIEMSSGIAAMVPTVLSAAADPEPRVRQAALRFITTSNAVAGRGVATKALARDEWTFVRVAAAEAIGALPADRASSAALGQSLTDPSAHVRAASLTALAKLRAVAEAPRVRARLDDVEENSDVRALAARSLGAMCVQNAMDRLTKLALRSRAPVDEADERIGTAAIDALAALSPADLRKRLAPLLDKNVPWPVRRAADRALSEPGNCK
jgi:hypothetical protein